MVFWNWRPRLTIDTGSQSEPAVKEQELMKHRHFIRQLTHVDSLSLLLLGWFWDGDVAGRPLVAPPP